jgi:hypothetical protein
MTLSLDSIVESRPREQWADNLRVAVIAGVIVLRSATAYLVETAGWYYEERATSGVWLVLLSGPVRRSVQAGRLGRFAGLLVMRRSSVRFR